MMSGDLPLDTAAKLHVRSLRRGQRFTIMRGRLFLADRVLPRTIFNVDTRRYNSLIFRPFARILLISC